MDRIYTLLLFFCGVALCCATKSEGLDSTNLGDTEEERRIQGPAVKYRFKRQNSVEERIEQLEDQLRTFIQTLNSGELKGEQGESGREGLPGKPGPYGRKGSVGLTGLQGVPGVAGAPGFPGRDGIKGLPGDMGFGRPGPLGRKGEIGDDGLPGLNGVDGLKGSRGDTGFPGFAGRDVTETGDRGPPGPPGPRGIDGNDLELTIPVVSRIMMRIEDLKSKVDEYDRKFKKHETSTTKLFDN